MRRDGARTLVVRGGSIAAGHGARTGYTEHVRAMCEEAGVNFVNVSRPGETSFDGVWTFDADVAPLRPDILVIHFGIDDAFSSVYRSEFKENLVRMVNAARRDSDTVIVMPTSHTFDDTYEMDAVNIYYRTIREVCQDLGCMLAAVHTFWAGHRMERGVENRDLVQEDPRLPSEEGHRLIARAVTPVISRAIAGVMQRAGRDPHRA